MILVCKYVALTYLSTEDPGIQRTYLSRNESCLGLGAFSDEDLGREFMVFSLRHNVQLEFDEAGVFEDFADFDVGFGVGGDLFEFLWRDCYEVSDGAGMRQGKLPVDDWKLVDLHLGSAGSRPRACMAGSPKDDVIHVGERMKVLMNVPFAFCR